MFDEFVTKHHTNWHLCTLQIHNIYVYCSKTANSTNWWTLLLVFRSDSTVSSNGDLYSAVPKHVIRYHIQNLCRSAHCVDSLVIYLNTPTNSDGSMLLWDADGDGIVRYHWRPFALTTAYGRPVPIALSVCLRPRWVAHCSQTVQYRPIVCLKVEYGYGLTFRIVPFSTTPGPP